MNPRFRNETSGFELSDSSRDEAGIAEEAGRARGNTNQVDGFEVGNLQIIGAGLNGCPGPVGPDEMLRRVEVQTTQPQAHQDDEADQIPC